MPALSPRFLLLLVMSAPLVCGFSNAQAQGSGPATASKVKAKPYAYSLQPQQLREAHKAIQNAPAVKVAAATLGKTLKRLQGARAALEKFPGNKRSIKRFHGQATSAQAAAQALAALFAPPAGEKTRALASGDKAVLQLAKEITSYLDGLVGVVKGKQAGLGEDDLASLASRQAAATRALDTLHALLQPTLPL